MATSHDLEALPGFRCLLDDADEPLLGTGALDAFRRALLVAGPVLPGEMFLPAHEP
jgi:hypothetical protein